MDREKAIGLLIEGVLIGQAKGAYSLEDASKLFEAVLKAREVPTQGVEKDS